MYADCLDVKRAGNDRSGVYDITVGQNTVPVYCDMETDEGGWTVSGLLISTFILAKVSYSAYRILYNE